MTGAGAIGAGIIGIAGIRAGDAKRYGDIYCRGVFNAGDSNTAWGYPVQFASESV